MNTTLPTWQLIIWPQLTFLIIWWKTYSFKCNKVDAKVKRTWIPRQLVWLVEMFEYLSYLPWHLFLHFKEKDNKHIKQVSKYCNKRWQFVVKTQTILMIWWVCHVWTIICAAGPMFNSPLPPQPSFTSVVTWWKSFFYLSYTWPMDQQKRIQFSDDSYFYNVVII